MMPKVFTVNLVILEVRESYFTERTRHNFKEKRRLHL